ncbi:MAG TPA: glycosyltransferase family 1 protein [Burkholderiales bacterium]|nr:glycosyltransferase family 1 protein [Burkholderiales bacterium]
MNDSAFLLQEPAARSSSLRVGVVSETFPPEINGVSMTVGKLVSALQDRHYHVQLIRPRQGPADRPQKGEKLEEILCRGLRIPRYAGLQFGLPAKRVLSRLWRLWRPDVVHIVTEGQLGWSALAAATEHRLPDATGFQTNFHSYSEHYRVGFLRKPVAAYSRNFHNRALVTMVPTEAMRRDLARRGYRNLRVVSLDVDSRLFSPARRDPALRASWGVGDAPVALYVGRLASEKNLALVAKAFDAMRKHDPACKLVWVGDGLRRAALQRRFPDHIFAGMRTGAELAAHYASANVFLFPSLTETFGNVTLEAMASGLAVVAYDYAAAALHVEHGARGVLAPYANADAFSCRAAALAADPDCLFRLRAGARAAAERLDWERVFDDYERVLDEVIRAQRASHG